MDRSIVRFFLDAEQAWVAELSCGHTQHMRHDPPWQSRPWVLSEAGREAQLGSSLDCVFCNMAALPEGLTAYKRTPTFTEETLPAALRDDHRTKAGVWAQIVVEEGKLEYRCTRGTFVLRPGVLGVVEPDSPHCVRPVGAVRLHVVFLRAR
jgi:tellurite methyltransferase